MALIGAYKINGIPMQGEELTSGRIRWVSSVSGSDGNSGADPKHPFATLDTATNYFSSNSLGNTHGVVYIMPNHAETIAGSTTWVPDTAGIQYIGIGTGSDMPELTFSATGSKVLVTGDNNTFKNIRFVAGISAVVTGVEVNDADHVLFDGCEWDFSTTAYDFVWHIRLDTAHYCKIKNCHFIAENATAGADAAIVLDASNYVEITDNIISGDYAKSGIWSAATEAVGKSIVIARNQIYNDDTASTWRGIIALWAAHTGHISDNRGTHLCKAGLSSDAIHAAACGLFENYVASTAGGTGILVGHV